ncbi:Ras-related protein RABF2b [Platanthera zijinensis]|uniref:Ras-related protein RABF2b n=1 Tax=Platanthera zijinensis TaxID=2320716 RepID=A0AAP0BCW9_9ASPA
MPPLVSLILVFSDGVEPRGHCPDAECWRVARRKITEESWQNALHVGASWILANLQSARREAARRRISAELWPVGGENREEKIGRDCSSSRSSPVQQWHAKHSRARLHPNFYGYRGCEHPVASHVPTAHHVAPPPPLLQPARAQLPTVSTPRSSSAMAAHGGVLEQRNVVECHCAVLTSSISVVVEVSETKADRRVNPTRRPASRGLDGGWLPGEEGESRSTAPCGRALWPRLVAAGSRPLGTVTPAGEAGRGAVARPRGTATTGRVAGHGGGRPLGAVAAGRLADNGRSVVRADCKWIMRADREAQTYAEENGLFFKETSAKTATNVNEIFHEIVEVLACVRHLQNSYEIAGGIDGVRNVIQYVQAEFQRGNDFEAETAFALADGVAVKVDAADGDLLVGALPVRIAGACAELERRFTLLEGLRLVRRNYVLRESPVPALPAS